ncbi:hypothetical protein EC991_010655 [Linnemannia zychae]|nr:hypothetical protein EC991_010655 [Linnemannia zychae]
MKIIVPLLLVALASTTQALRLGYNAFAAANINGAIFRASMFIDGDNNVGNVFEEGGTSKWVQWGIHKIQLKNARMDGFHICIDVAGDVSCTPVVVGPPSCGFNPNNQRPECKNYWKDDNWGNK